MSASLPRAQFPSLLFPREKPLFLRTREAALGCREKPTRRPAPGKLLGYHKCGCKRLQTAANWCWFYIDYWYKMTKLRIRGACNLARAPLSQHQN